MTALDANPDDTARNPASEPPAPPPVVGPMAGDPAMLGLSSFIVGSIALGLGLVGVVPVGVLGAPLAIILAATALGLLLAAVWAAAVGQSAVAAVFGIFGTFWLSYAVLVLGLDHNWFAITIAAVLATVKLFLVSWLVAIIMLTLATLRLPSAFTAVFVLVDLALLLLLLAFAEASPLGVPSTGLLKTAGYVVLVFAAIGVYLFYDAAQAGTGGKRMIGLILCSLVRPDVGHITQVCILPEYRSAGIGVALLAATTRSLRERHFGAISLTVTQANDRAIALYHRIGFDSVRVFDAFVWEG